jgi:endonuclease YncB( thermonuclease family)
MVVAALVLGLAGCSTPEDGAPPAASDGDSSSVEAGRDDAAGVESSSGDALPVDVIDGDTLTIEVGGVAERVRLVGINAPEDGECFSEEATAALAELVDGRTVRLAVDETDRDRYGRLLRYVSVGDQLVNEALVRAGVARSAAYPPDTARQADLDAAEAAARAAGVGLWAVGACGPAPVGGDQTVRIVTVVADPEGPDEQVANEELATIENGGEAAADLSGWVLKDTTASHRFTFPAGFRLSPGGQVHVHTGCGEPGPADLYWCNQGSMVWNNDGDTAYLEDPNGNTVSVLEVH